MTASPPPRRTWWSILIGTRPGLEWFLFAVFPALAAGAVASHWLGTFGGVAVGAVVLVLGIRLGRRLGRRGSEGPTDPRT